MSDTITKDIWIQGMHCDACEKTIRKSLERIGVGVEDIRYTNNRVELLYDPLRVPFSQIEGAVADVGYRVRETPPEESGPRETSIERAKRVFHSFRNDPEAYQLEKQVIKSTLGTLFIAAALEYLIYFIFFWNIQGFLHTYGQYLGYLIVGVVATGGAVRHLRAYQGAVSCMTGMMIGMTIGMISGLLLGAVVGATNGMFVGSVFGMAVGMAVGGWVGVCCGIMGLMEGMMAGLMGGTMGAMIGVMMIPDRLTLFLPIFFVACLAILAGLSYMVYKEHKGARDEVKLYGFWPYTFINFAFVLAGTIIIVWGPKAAFLR